MSATFGKTRKLSQFVVPEPMRTLPFQLLRTGNFARNKAEMAAAIQAGPSPTVAAWIPARMALTNRWKTNQESSSVTSPVAAVYYGGKTLREVGPMPTAHIPTSTIAQQGRYQSSGMRQAVQPIPARMMQPAPSADLMGRTVPQVSGRISGQALNTSVTQLRQTRMNQAEDRSAKLAYAIQSAMQHHLLSHTLKAR